MAPFSGAPDRSRRFQEGAPMARSDVAEPREDAAARARPGHDAEAREPQPPRGRTEDRQQDQGRSEQPSPEDQATAKRKKRRWLLIGAAVALVVLVGGGWYGWHWWTVGRYMVSTDDAYTEADSVTVSPQVAGYVAELRVTDNQEVRQGDVLLRSTTAPTAPGSTRPTPSSRPPRPTSTMSAPRSSASRPRSPRPRPTSTRPGPS